MAGIARRRPCSQERRIDPKDGEARTFEELEAACKDNLATNHDPLPTVLPIFTDFYRFFGLSWETSTLKNYHPEDSGHSGSGRIEFSSKSTTFLM